MMENVPDIYPGQVQLIIATKEPDTLASLTLRSVPGGIEALDHNPTIHTYMYARICMPLVPVDANLLHIMFLFR